jgi:hypothetical protein
LTNEDFELEKFYKSFLSIQQRNAVDFEHEFQQRVNDANSEVSKMEESDRDNLEKILLILSLVNISNSYRKAAELLIDELKETKIKLPGTSNNKKA